MAHRKEDKMFFSLDLHEQIVVALGINLHHQSGDLTVNTDFNVMTAIDKWGKDKSYNVTYLLNKKQLWGNNRIGGSKTNTHWIWKLGKAVACGYHFQKLIQTWWDMDWDKQTKVKSDKSCGGINHGCVAVFLCFYFHMHQVYSHKNTGAMGRTRGVVIRFLALIALSCLWDHMKSLITAERDSWILACM